MYSSDHGAASKPVEFSSPATLVALSDADPRREEILAVARTLFAQKGYKAATMAEIAAGANLAVGTVYKFFKDKQTLYQTLVVMTMCEFEKGSIDALRDTPGDAIDKIRRYILVGSEIFARNIDLIRVYYSETGAAFLFAAAGLQDEAFDIYRRIVDALTETFRQGVEKGLFIDLLPEELALGLEGVHNAFLNTLVHDANRYTPAQITERATRIYFETVLRQ